jgi:hypothetical protein
MIGTNRCQVSGVSIQMSEVRSQTTADSGFRDLGIEEFRNWEIDIKLGRIHSIPKLL